MAHGDGKKGKFALSLHKDPAACTPEELAVMIALTTQLAAVEKLGVDPTTVHVVLQFKETGHQMCGKLGLDEGDDEKPPFKPCSN